MTTPTPPTGAPLLRRRVPLVGATAAALLLGVAGYALGHHRSGESRAPQSSSCATADAALQRQTAAAKDAGSDSGMRTLANLVVQNKQCFDPQLTAAAQTLLDKMDQGSTALEIYGAFCKIAPGDC